MSETVITVDNVVKKYVLRQHGGRTLKAAVLDFLRGRRADREFMALKGVSFEVSRGETLGIIGANGAGKSTLLAILTGTITPTSGTKRISGTVSALLELGAGFHPDLTGRENIYLSGAIMGLSREQMKAKEQPIIDFAEIHNFIDQPVKHYSSGMYVRLGFAVAVEVNPDILLIDEILAVGDLSFQKKCLQKMAEFREQGKTMLIISHDLRTIRAISDRILLLDEGQIKSIGKPEEVVQSYESLTRVKDLKTIEREWGSKEVKIAKVELLDKAGRAASTLQYGEPLKVRIRYETTKRIEDPVFGFAFANDRGQVVYGNNTQLVGHKIPEISGSGDLLLTIDKISLSAGLYAMSFSVHSSDHTTNYHRLDNMLQVTIENPNKCDGFCYMPCSWDGPRAG